MDMNVVSLIGRLTNDVEAKSAGKTQVANFTVAVQGYKEKVDFINCVAWGGWATNLAKYGKKGMRVSVVGSISTNTYQKDSGETVYQTNVNVREIILLETRAKNDNENETAEEVIGGSAEEEAPF